MKRAQHRFMHKPVSTARHADRGEQRRPSRAPAASSTAAAEGGMNRRGFLSAILAASVAPAVVKAASLMPWRPTASGLLTRDYGLRCATVLVDALCVDGPLKGRVVSVQEGCGIAIPVAPPNARACWIGHGVPTPMEFGRIVYRNYGRDLSGMRILSCA